MKIAVNTRFLLDKKLEGFGKFTYETLKRMVQNHPEHQFYFIFDRPYHERFIFSDNVIPVITYPPARHPILWYWWYELSLPRVFEKIKPDLFLSTDGYLSLHATLKQISVIHDLNFEHYPDDFPKLVKYYLRHYFPKFAHKADRIITVSKFSMNDIIETYRVDPQKIDVACNGADAKFSPLSDELKRKAKDKFANECDYFVYVGALLPRKNVARLLKAFDTFKEVSPNPAKLLIVGAKMFRTRDIEDTYTALRHKADVIFTGHLSEDDVILALGGAIALTYVSYFEGFGIPIVEAMNADVPVITSNITSMPEVAGDAAILADPFSVESIAHAMYLVYSDEPLRKSLIEKGRARRELFSWDKAAEVVWTSIENCVQLK